MMSEEFIYLDYAATTPVDPAVAEFMLECRRTAFANPSSTHAAGRKSRALIDTAVASLGSLLNADPATLVWTSGATESDNLAIIGGARYREHRGKHLITMPSTRR